MKSVGSKKKRNTKQLLKLTFCSFLFSLCFIYSLLWNHWPELVGKYASFLICFVFLVILVCCCFWFLLMTLLLFFHVIFFLLHVREVVNGYGLLAGFALYAGFLECGNT